LKHTPQPRQASLEDDFLIRQLVPPDHELLQIDQAVDFAFVHDVVADLYCPDNGRPATDPELLLRLSVLQRMHGLSDRAVMERGQTDLAFRAFLHLNWDDRLPDHSTLHVFRSRLGERFEQVFQGFVAQAVRRGHVQGSRLLVDSFTVQADAAVPRLRALLMTVIEQTLEALPPQASWAQQEYEALSKDPAWDQNAATAAEQVEQWFDLAGRMREALLAVDPHTRTKAQYEAIGLLNSALNRHGPKRKGKRRDALVSATDPDARWGCKKRGKQPVAGYTEQIAVDADSGIVTEVLVAPANVDDSQMLQPLVAGHTAKTGAKPAEVIADSKYLSGDNVAHLQSEEITDYIAAPTPKGHKQGRYSTSDFEVEYEGDEPVRARCPNGEWSERPKWKEPAHSWVFHFTKGQCEGCPLRAQCTQQKRGRSLSVSVHHRRLRAVRARQATPEFEAAQVTRLNIERKFARQRKPGGGRLPWRGLPQAQTFGWLWGCVLNIWQLTKLAVAEIGENLDRGPTGAMPRAHCA
jgi:IS5 family transposase